MAIAAIAAAVLLIVHPVLWVPVVALGYYLLHVAVFALPLYAYYEVEYRIRRYRWRRATAASAVRGGVHSGRVRAGGEHLAHPAAPVRPATV